MPLIGIRYRILGEKVFACLGAIYSVNSFLVDVG